MGRIEMSRVWIPLAFLAFLLIFASAEENQNKFEDNGQDKEMDAALNGRENVAPSLTEEASLKRSFREPRKKKSTKGGNESRRSKGKGKRKNKGRNKKRKNKNKNENKIKIKLRGKGRKILRGSKGVKNKGRGNKRRSKGGKNKGRGNKRPSKGGKNKGRGNKRPSKGGKNKGNGKRKSAIYKKMKNKKEGSLRVAGRTKTMRVRENGY